MIKNKLKWELKSRRLFNKIKLRMFEKVIENGNRITYLIMKDGIMYPYELDISDRDYPMLYLDVSCLDIELYNEWECCEDHCNNKGDKSCCLGSYRAKIVEAIASRDILWLSSLVAAFIRENHYGVDK